MSSDDRERTKALLKQAKALIEDRRNWCKGTMTVIDGKRTKRCALGAISHVCNTSWNPDAAACEYALSEALPPGYRLVAEVNDEAGHNAVLAMFDRAIANQSVVE